MSRLFPILALIVAVGLFVGYINPTYRGPVAELRERIDDYDSALDAAAEFKERQTELANDRASLPADQLERLEAMLPDGVDNVQLILDLNSLAARSGMRLADFETVVTPEELSGGDLNAYAGVEGPTDHLDLTMSGTGTYASFRAFLEGLENSLRPLDIVGLKITSAPSGVYSYDITVRLYWLR